MAKKLPDTSLAAGRQFTGVMKKTHHLKIISALQVLGVANYEKISIWLGMKNANQISRRLKEMELLELVFKPGSKSSTTSGRAAYNYQLTGNQPKTEVKNERVMQGDGIADFSRKIDSITKSVQGRLL